uniref:MalT-like TPR region domain-containing protein n=1 Tax=Chromera velia CCMP2878 TaxID=1169474 RepID=A0A0G4H114_9ALVE|eukprot:Cvel_5524.t1-p1 / transcript=Cvel_5524.t1 / gene=Cvel_5524 / organism=Chromera_velia_CCMP2878 / gene_product=hypothetical protein / transcript_product=hypothetical protein / location=Cvel_scaffold259:4915-12218(+) / protein_length=1231 / sequence_SO=supercontig / SO=protein_coding / is_pseudo=false
MPEQTRRSAADTWLHAITYFNTGCVRFVVGDFARAVTYLKHAIGLEEKCQEERTVRASTHINMAAALLASMRANDAVAHALKAITLADPNSCPEGGLGGSFPASPLCVDRKRACLLDPFAALMLACGLQTLGVAFHKLGAPRLAVRYLTDAEAVALGVLGGDHPLRLQARDGKSDIEALTGQAEDEEERSGRREKRGGGKERGRAGGLGGAGGRGGSLWRPKWAEYWVDPPCSGSGDSPVTCRKGRSPAMSRMGRVARRVLRGCVCGEAEGRRSPSRPPIGVSSTLGSDESSSSGSGSEPSSGSSASSSSCQDRDRDRSRRRDRDSRRREKEKSGRHRRDRGKKGRKCRKESPLSSRRHIATGPDDLCRDCGTTPARCVSYRPPHKAPPAPVPAPPPVQRVRDVPTSTNDFDGPADRKWVESLASEVASIKQALQMQNKLAAEAQQVTTSNTIMHYMQQLTRDVHDLKHPTLGGKPFRDCNNANCNQVDKDGIGPNDHCSRTGDTVSSRVSGINPFNDPENLQKPCKQQAAANTLAALTKQKLQQKTYLTDRLNSLPRGRRRMADGGEDSDFSDSDDDHAPQCSHRSQRQHSPGRAGHSPIKPIHHPMCVFSPRHKSCPARGMNPDIDTPRPMPPPHFGDPDTRSMGHSPGPQPSVCGVRQVPTLPTHPGAVGLRPPPPNVDGSYPLTGYPVASPSLFQQDAFAPQPKNTRPPAAAAKVTFGDLEVPVTGDQESLRQAAELLSAAARHEHDGFVDRALTCARRALQIKERVLGQTSEALAPILMRVARCESVLGQWDSAATNLFKAVGILREHRGERHTETAEALQQLGGVLFKQGGGRDRLEEAKNCLVQATAIKAEAMGGNHIQVGVLLTQTGRVCLEIEDLSAALEAYSSGVRIVANALGNDRPELGDALYGLGLVHLRLVLSGKARENFEDCFDIRRRHFERKYGKGMVTFSEQKNKGALSSRTKEKREAAGELLKVKMKLAACLEQEGEISDALDMLHDLLKDSLHTFGEFSDECAVLRWQLAPLVAQVGNKGGAIRLVQKALPLREAMLGTHHPDIIAMKQMAAQWNHERIVPVPGAGPNEEGGITMNTSPGLRTQAGVRKPVIKPGFSSRSLKEIRLHGQGPDFSPPDQFFRSQEYRNAVQLGKAVRSSKKNQFDRKDTRWGREYDDSEEALLRAHLRTGTVVPGPRGGGGATGVGAGAATSWEGSGGSSQSVSQHIWGWKDWR